MGTINMFRNDPRIDQFEEEAYMLMDEEGLDWEEACVQVAKNWGIYEEDDEEENWETGEDWETGYYADGTPVG